MGERILHSSRASSARRSHVATRYVLLAFFLIFALYRVHVWTPRRTIVATHQTTPFDPSLHTDKKNESDDAPPEGVVLQTGSVQSSSLPPQPEFMTAPNDEPSTFLQSRIGKVTSVYYDDTSTKSQAYELALLSHKEHDTLYGYKHFVQRHPAIDGLGPKQAYLIHILVQELNKPPPERLDWLFWHDADVVLLNSLIPLEVYLPPNEDRWLHINFLMSNDLGGLNDGTFFVRVCEWSVRFFAAAMSFPYYRPEVHLRYDAQTAMGFLLDEEAWKNVSLHVPQRWFNAYHNFGDDNTIPSEWNWRHDYIKPGDLLVHLPGTGDGRSGLIQEWLDRLVIERDTYVVPLNDTDLPARLKDFWEYDAATEYERQDKYWRHYHILNHIGSETDDATRRGKEKLKEKLKAEGGNGDEEIEAAVKEYEESRKEVKKELLRDEERAIQNGTKSDNVRAA